jgi:hypothetical protein
MVTFKCTGKDCVNKDVEYNFLGDLKTAQCGGCGSQVKATDKRPDPVIEELTLDAVTD